MVDTIEDHQELHIENDLSTSIVFKLRHFKNDSFWPNTLYQQILKSPSIFKQVQTTKIANNH